MEDVKELKETVTGESTCEMASEERPDGWEV